MMTQRFHMTAAGSYLHVKIGLGFSIDKPEVGATRDQATRFYWSLFQMLHKDLHLMDGQQGRVLRLSFEDDFAVENKEEEADEDDDSRFIPMADFLNDEEEDPWEEDEEEDVEKEFSNK